MKSLRRLELIFSVDGAGLCFPLVCVLPTLKSGADSGDWNARFEGGLNLQDIFLNGRLI